MSFRSVPAIDECYTLAEEAVAALPKWQLYLDGVTETLTLLWSLPDAQESDKTRWISNLLLETANEIGMRAGQDVRDRIDLKARDIRAKHGIPSLPDDIDLDKKADIAAQSDDLKTIVAAGMVVTYDKLKDRAEIIEALKDRFNAHAAGIAPADIPASLHKKMSDAITALNHPAP